MRDRLQGLIVLFCSAVVVFEICKFISTQEIRYLFFAVALSIAVLLNILQIMRR